MLISIYGNWTLSVFLNLCKFHRDMGNDRKYIPTISPTLVLYIVTFWQLVYN